MISFKYLTNMTNAERLGSLLVISTLILYIVASLFIIKVPVFADGAQHVWLTEHVYTTGALPSSDITGVQPSNFNVPVSINNSQPFLYAPLFYIFAGSVSFFTGSAQSAVELIDVLSAIFTALFLALALRNLFGRQAAFLGFFLILGSNMWLWMLVHRLVEPILLCYISAFFYILVKLKHQVSMKYAVLLGLFSAALLATKQSMYPVVAAIFLVLLMLKQWRRGLIGMALTVGLIAPVLLFSLHTSGTLLPSPIGWKPIDSMFTYAWWNQKPAKWEVELNALVDVDSLRQKTYAQFKEVQRSPGNLVTEYGITGLINQYNAYSTAPVSTEGYQSSVPSKTYLIFLLLILLAPIAIFALKRDNHRDLVVPGLYLLVQAILGTLLWVRQPVFRYYIYLLITSFLLYSISLVFLLKKLPRQSSALLMAIVISAVAINDYNEVKRDLNYKYTAMHRALPGTNGGLADSIAYGQKEASRSSAKNHIFTPMVEVAYYSHKSYLWDNRLFFVHDKEKLIEMIGHYDFDTVVVPFYSGSLSMADWRYSEGIPSDSTFQKLLEDTSYFQVVERNATFTAYRRVGN